MVVGKRKNKGGSSNHTAPAQAVLNLHQPDFYPGNALGAGATAASYDPWRWPFEFPFTPYQKGKAKGHGQGQGQGFLEPPFGGEYEGLQ